MSEHPWFSRVQVVLATFWDLGHIDPDTLAANPRTAKALLDAGSSNGTDLVINLASGTFLAVKRDEQIPEGTLVLLEKGAEMATIQTALDPDSHLLAYPDKLEDEGRDTATSTRRTTPHGSPE